MRVDPIRWEEKDLWEVYYETEIYVEAQTPDGKRELVDIAFLDEESLEKWLEKLSKGELTRLVKILLQHRG